MPHAHRQETSAGGVLIRRAGGHYEVCLILRQRHGRAWGLPKGHLEPGEDAAAAAVREVQEETGVSGAILESLGTIAYQFRTPNPSALVTKTVSFFLMRPTGATAQGHDAEAIDVRWVPIDEALATVAYDNERRVLKRARALLAREALARRLDG